MLTSVQSRQMALLSLCILMNSLLSPALTCETDTLRSPVTVSVVGRENNILSCSSTTCCSAADLAENLFSGGVISCYVARCAL